MKKRYLIAALCIVLVAGLAGAGTMAWFTASVTSMENTFQVGTLALSGADGQAFASINIGDMRPGEPVHEASTILRNNGTLPLKLYKINAENIVDEDGLDSVLDVEVKIDNISVYTGKLSQLVEENGGHFNPIILVESGTEVALELFVKMSEEAGNQYQDLSLSCDFSIFAAQVDMPLTGQVGGWESLATSNNNLFSVKGTNTSSRVRFDIDWNTNDLADREEYNVFIKHQTGDPNSIVEVTRQLRFVWIIPYNDVKITQVLEDGEVDVTGAHFDIDEKIISINKSGFPNDWEIVDIKITGMRDPLIGSSYSDETNYFGWHLNR